MRGHNSICGTVVRSIPEETKKEDTIMTEKRSGCGCNHIKGVCCDVKNCMYHDGESYCTAKEITVGPSYAADGKDTNCATFKPHDQYANN